MADIVERLRDWRDYEPAKMFGGEILKDTSEAADVIERLCAALKPFCDADWYSQGNGTYEGRVSGVALNEAKKLLNIQQPSEKQ